MTPIDAAITGMREIFGAIVAMTITLAAVYAPIGFTQGLTGALFREFAFALAGAVVISGFVAVTVSPMMSARLLRRRQRPLASVSSTGPSIGVAGLVRAGGSPAALEIPAGDADDRRRGPRHARLHVHAHVASWRRRKIRARCSRSSTARATRHRTTRKHLRRPDRRADRRRCPEPTRASRSSASAAAFNAGFAVWRFVPWGERDAQRGADPAADPRRLVEDPGRRGAGVRSAVVAGHGGGLPVQYVIRSVGAPDQVYDVAERDQQEAMKSGKFIVVQNSLAFDLPRARC